MNPVKTLPKGPQPVPKEAPSRPTFACIRIALLLLSSVALSGCATPALWKHTAARSWTPVPSGAKFLVTGADTQRDLIVVFRQSTDVGNKLAHRLVAWSPGCPQSALAIGPGAIHQLTNSCTRVRFLNCFPEDAVLADAVSTSDGYAFHGPGYDQFTVHFDGVATGPFDLPSSRQDPRLVRRFTILPFAVATDAVIVGVACCALAGSSGIGPVGR